MFDRNLGVSVILIIPEVVPDATTDQCSRLVVPDQIYKFLCLILRRLAGGIKPDECNAAITIQLSRNSYRLATHLQEQMICPIEQTYRILRLRTRPCRKLEDHQGISTTRLFNDF